MAPNPFSTPEQQTTEVLAEPRKAKSKIIGQLPKVVVAIALGSWLLVLVSHGRFPLLYLLVPEGMSICCLISCFFAIKAKRSLVDLLTWAIGGLLGPIVLIIVGLLTR